MGLDTTTQEILQKGEPTKVEFTDHEATLALWAKSLTIEELIGAQYFPPNTVAENLRQFVHEQLEADAPLQELPIPGVSTESLSSRDREQTDKHKQLRRSRIPHQALDKGLEKSVVGILGGRFVKYRLPLPRVDNPREALRVQSWQAPDGRRMVIRKLQVGGGHGFRKSRELFAEARMLRALDPSVHGLLLLLSVEASAHPSRVRHQQRPQPIDPYLVNVLEEGGWKVFPWDFAEREPAFIGYLRAWSS